MKFGKQHREFKETVSEFFNREVSPNIETWEEDRAFPARSLYAKMGSLGFLGISYPERYGGLGLDFSYAVLFAECLGQIDCGGVPMSISVQTDMCTPALAAYGSDLLKETFLVPAIAGTQIGAIAVTELHAGSDATAIRTTAKLHGDHYIVNGQKSYITNGGVADFVVTLCRTSEVSGREFSLLVIPASSEGYSTKEAYRKLGNLSCNHAEIVFNDVKVPKDYVIGTEGPGIGLQVEQLSRERLISSIIHCSQSERVLDKLVHHVRQRFVFGKALIEHEYVANLMSVMKTDLYFLQSSIYSCADDFAAGKECSMQTAMLKYKAGKLIRIVTDTALQLFGAYGYMEDLSLQRSVRDARAASIAGGTEETMLYQIGKYL